MAFDLFSLFGVIVAVVLPFYIIIRIYYRWLHPIAMRIVDMINGGKR